MGSRWRLALAKRARPFERTSSENPASSRHRCTPRILKYKAAIRVDFALVSSRRLACVHWTCRQFMEDTMRASLTETMSRSVPVAIIGIWAVIGASGATAANVITDWDEKAVSIVLPPGPVAVAQQVYTAQRMMGLVHAAMFDAVDRKSVV